MVSQIKREFNYWSAILNRIVAVIRFLAGRGLAFRGHNEVIGSSNNGNYLGMLEMLTQFDPVLKQPIDTFANKGKGNVNYLSKTICEELIDIMSQKVLTHIITEKKKAKYWGIIVGLTPDISHVDQLSVVFRYYLNGHVYERFFCFLQIKSHDGKSLITDILDLLERYDIDITNCRGQAYDNASNMSASTHRWDLLKGNHATLKHLSDTRWSCRSDASKSLVENFDGIHAALCHIAEDTEEKSDTRHEVLCLLNKITKLEFAFMAVLWHHILKRFNAVSKFFQKVELDLHTASSMLLSLTDFVKNLRNDFTRFENESKKLSSFIEKDYSDKNKKKYHGIAIAASGFFSHKKDKSETVNTLIPLHVLNWIVETDIIDVFPNVYIA
ncbi:uncharacterized protein LOC136086152 [Hydra vulgaris]|uniref:Uncharacterized protein LOC136086152 n=1 Tax=Hydra vulgaris TaxID=6087 RepID=A0ABM4CRK4_HYDVU